jgi:transposase-like protein
MKLKAAADLLEGEIHGTLSFHAYPSQHWLKLKTNNPMARLLNEARRRTKAVGAFPNGHSALMLVAARLRHVSATQWGTRKYMNIKMLDEMDKRPSSQQHDRRPAPSPTENCETRLTSLPSIRIIWTAAGGFHHSGGAIA